MFVRGQHRGQAFSRLMWRQPPRPLNARPWDGADWVVACDYRPAPRPEIAAAPALFLAHWRALPPGLALPETTRVWVSGVESWRRLAQRGQWIEGCADNLGFGAISATLGSPVLRLPPLAAWTVLTREDATATWTGTGVGRVQATYAIDAPAEESVLREIRHDVARATHFFWGSAAQYRALRDCLPAGSHHACGPGKTYQALSADGLPNLQAFPSRREWRRWVA
jgi:hydroxymethylbilane synthase